MTAPVLDLDLDAFEGPFDLLLTLILKEELSLAEVEVADIVTSFAERLDGEHRLDLEACGEFLVLVGAMSRSKPASSSRKRQPTSGTSLPKRPRRNWPSASRRTGG